jgi:hypothetical protein
MTLMDGLINGALGVAIAVQWPLSGAWALGFYVGVRLLSTGWALLLGRTGESANGDDALRRHPDTGLGLPPHAEFAKLRAELAAADQAHSGTDRYWRGAFLVTFFAIHFGRMDAEWNLVGFLSPGVAVLGDICFALILTYGLVIPVLLGWRSLTRPLERRAWARLLARIDAGRGPGLPLRLVRPWLVRRLRFSLRMSAARRSPTAAIGRGLQLGLPVIAVLIATNPIWGFSWFFNTENWATGVWEMWAEQRTDTWREEMVRAVGRDQPDVPPAERFAVHPDGVADADDFSFLVIGDPGEGDPSQHILRDQFLLLGQRPDVRFLVVSSDVIYPSGSMKDYEGKFYLPFKGFTRPIYAIPGNHDWYDALEAFTANFLEPGAARSALRARREADHGLTTTTEARIEGLIAEAGRLRREYGVTTGLQRGPFFEVQARRFALLAVDTGILRGIDPEQKQWLRAALGRARGKFVMVVPGHPFYAGGHDQGTNEPAFAELHELLREANVDVVMAGDTHSLEHYEEEYTLSGQARRMAHFVNGGGGAYLSIGTSLAWPAKPATARWAYYPRTEAMIDKLGRETPTWKQPLWWWVKRLGAWPSSPEAVASAFDFNHAPFFQSFAEVRVEGSANRVRLLFHGANGRLRWRDFQTSPDSRPAGTTEDDFVEFAWPLRPVEPRP